MARLTVDAAAFHGFGLVKRDPQTFLGVAILLALFGGALALVMIPAYANLLDTVMTTPQTQKGSTADPMASLEAMTRFWGAVGPLYLLMIPILMIVLGALNRSLVFGKSSGWVLGLKLGMDEVRAFLVTIVGYILVMIPYVLGVIVVVVVAGGVGAATGGEGAGAAIAAVLGVVGYCAALGLMLWVGVRLSYAVPASVGEGRFVIFESWSMTKGRFWTLFFSYVIVFLAVAVIELVVFAVVALAFGGLAANVDWENLDFSAFQTVSIGPTVIVGAALYGLLASFVSAAFYGVAARGYVAWKEGTVSPAS